MLSLIIQIHKPFMLLTQMLVPPLQNISLLTKFCNDKKAFSLS